MHFIRLQSTKGEIYSQAIELYKQSFPLHEQRNPISQEQIMLHPQYQFNLIYDKDVFVGIILCWETENFIYVEHFCIFYNMRNQSYGKKTLTLILLSKSFIIL